ncbi:hypothetical protein [Streptomyces poonensis]|uniref:hypothetical protein n=1 Tax=Streptomyces poonensis TaxID=68255 RepID=UPI001E2FC509|nr:hypothetical protein [Streptomyces poonensis]
MAERVEEVQIAPIASRGGSEGEAEGVHETGRVAFGGGGVPEGGLDGGGRRYGPGAVALDVAQKQPDVGRGEDGVVYIAPEPDAAGRQGVDGRREGRLGHQRR